MAFKPNWSAGLSSLGRSMMAYGLYRGREDQRQAALASYNQRAQDQRDWYDKRDQRRFEMEQQAKQQAEQDRVASLIPPSQPGFGLQLNPTGFAQSPGALGDMAARIYEHRAKYPTKLGVDKPTKPVAGPGTAVESRVLDDLWDEVPPSQRLAEKGLGLYGSIKSAAIDSVNTGRYSSPDAIAIASAASPVKKFEDTGRFRIEDDGTMRYLVGDSRLGKFFQSDKTVEDIVEIGGGEGALFKVGGKWKTVQYATGSIMEPNKDELALVEGR